MAVAVMGGAEEPKIIGLGAAAKRVGEDVIYLKQVPGAATAPAAPVHVAATAPVPLPNLPPDCGRDAAPPNPRPGSYPTTRACGKPRGRRRNVRPG